jgi:hypothetical protein
MAWRSNDGNLEEDIQGGPITTEELGRASQEVGAVQNLEYRLPSGDPTLTTVAGETTRVSAAWICEVLAWYGYHHMKAKESDRVDRGCIVP